MQQTDLEKRNVSSRRWVAPTRHKPLGDDVPVFSTTINRSPLEVQAILEQSENLPLFFGERPQDESFALRMTVSPVESGWIWNAEDNAHIKYVVGMSIEPAQAQRGTVVRLQVQYETLGGAMAAKFENSSGMMPRSSLKRI